MRKTASGKFNPDMKSEIVGGTTMAQHIRLKDFLSSSQISKPEPQNSYATLGTPEWLGLSRLDEAVAKDIMNQAKRAGDQVVEAEYDAHAKAARLALSRVAAQLSAAFTLVDYASLDMQEAMVNMPFSHRSDALNATLGLKDICGRLNSLRAYAAYISTRD